MSPLAQNRISLGGARFYEYVFARVDPIHRQIGMDPLPLLVKQQGKQSVVRFGPFDMLASDRVVEDREFDYFELTDGPHGVGRLIPYDGVLSADERGSAGALVLLSTEGLHRALRPLQLFVRDAESRSNVRCLAATEEVILLRLEGNATFTLQVGDMPLTLRRNGKRIAFMD